MVGRIPPEQKRTGNHGVTGGRHCLISGRRETRHMNTHGVERPIDKTRTVEAASRGDAAPNIRCTNSTTRRIHEVTSGGTDCTDSATESTDHGHVIFNPVAERVKGFIHASFSGVEERFCPVAAPRVEELVNRGLDDSFDGSDRVGEDRGYRISGAGDPIKRGGRSLFYC